MEHRLGNSYQSADSDDHQNGGGGPLEYSLEDGSPKYYNSNILGRYYKKDYFTEQ